MAHRFLISAAAAVFLAGCVQPGALPNRQILYGSSFATTDEAVQELSLAAANAEAFGCRMISLGAGTGLGAGGELGGMQIDVYGLIACPAGTPKLLPATGVAP